LDTVAIVKFEQDIIKTLSNGLTLLDGFGDLISPVLIKPNICTMKDATGYSVTDSNVVKALVSLIFGIDEDISIKIIESDSQSKNAKKAFVKFGYETLSQEMRESGLDVSTLDLSREPLEKISFDGNYFKDPELPRIITKPHYFISVAVAKTHYLSYITGVLKNLFGVLPRKDMSFYHSRIHDVITDVARIIRPKLNIIDARIGVEDWNGPKTHDIGVIILGKQPVSVDSVMTMIMSLDPQNVKHLVSSNENNLGTLSPSVLGEKIDSVKVRFTTPSD